MASGVGQRHHAAERRAEHDRLDDAKHVAERAHVVAPLRQGPALLRPGIAAPVAAVVEVDDLRVAKPALLESTWLSRLLEDDTCPACHKEIKLWWYGGQRW